MLNLHKDFENYDLHCQQAKQFNNLHYYCDLSKSITLTKLGFFIVTNSNVSQLISLKIFTEPVMI